MGYIGFKRFIKRYFYPIFSVQSSVFSLMFSLMRHRVNKYLHPSPTSLPSVHLHSYLENVANNSKPQQNTAPDLPF